MEGNQITRKMIIQTLVASMEPLAYVHAFWEGGAAAFNRIDEWSDLDLYFVVDDNKVVETFFAVEEALRSLSPIKQKYEIPQTPWPGVFQAFYKLENASEYLLIDLAVLTLSSPGKFLEPEIHGSNVFYFNKSNKVSVPLVDETILVGKLRERLSRLQARSSMFDIFVQKEINRGNCLEALDLYYGLTLATLVETLRIKHNPFHYDFKMRYVHYEFPPEIIEKLKTLYFVNDEKDLQEKHRQAVDWFHEALLSIYQRGIENLIKPS